MADGRPEGFEFEGKEVFAVLRPHQSGLDAGHFEIIRGEGCWVFGTRGDRRVQR